MKMLALAAVVKSSHCIAGSTSATSRHFLMAAFHGPDLTALESDANAFLEDDESQTSDEDNSLYVRMLKCPNSVERRHSDSASW